MSFFEQRFPESIKFGVVGGPRFSTSKAGAQNGFQARQRNWKYPLQKFDAAHGVKTESQFEAVRAFFYNVYGAADGFRFKDWSDFKVSGVAGQIITRADGSKQLARAYPAGARTFLRPISKPVAGTVVLTGGGVVDYTTGVVTGGAPTAWAGEFDVPVAFVEDLMDVELVNRKGANGEYFLSWSSIQLEEIRV